jgi:Methyltransferase domain
MIFNNPTLPSYELNQYINKLGNNIVGCEIGVCHAENFCHMLEVCDNITKLIGIDPYIEYADFNGYVADGQVQNFKEVTFQNLQKINAGDRAEIRILTSDDAVSTIDDGSLDFIFIDGNHSYEYVYRDVNNYYSKVKVGGIFAGHDYSMSSVSSVLKTFLEVNNIPFENLKLLQNDSWMLYKE